MLNIRALYYVRRIRQAPLHIILRKLNELFKKRLFRIFYYLKRCGLFSRSQAVVDKSITNLTRLGTDLRPRLILAGQNKEWHKNARLRAEKFLTRQFPILGYGVAEIIGGADWHCDVIHGFKWPEKYFQDIDFCTLKVKCDVKVPWEVSRFQYLLWLAEGYVLDEENRSNYLEIFEELVVDWIRSNPVGYGVNWIVSMEVAIRACNLTLAASVFANSVSPSTMDKIVESLHDHLDFINRFPEFSDVNGNHYLSNLMGVSVLSASLYGEHSGKSLTANDVFFHEADEQFEADGCHLERAPIYHRLCLDMVVIVLAFEARSGSISDIGLNCLSRGLDFCRAVSSSDGLLPVIGDSDSGHVLWFGEESRRFSGLEVIEKGLRGKQVISSDIKSNEVWHFAIFTDHYESACHEDEIKSIQNGVSNLSGFIAGHGDAIDCVMRVGEQGLKGRASHDHDDALSLWLSLNGKDFIVEHGCHPYTLDETSRTESILSLAHNLVQPIGCDRSQGGIGSIIKTAVGAPTAESWAVASQDGMFTLSAKLGNLSVTNNCFSYCVREVEGSLGNVGKLTVNDRWEWLYAEKEAELRWHFGPSIRIQLCPDTNGVVLLSDKLGNLLCRLTFDSPLPINVEVFTFKFSEKYGQIENSVGVRVTMAVHAKCEISSKFEFTDSQSTLKR